MDLQIRLVRDTDVKILAALFSELLADGVEQWFHPHPLTESEAERVCSRKGQDVYVLAFVDSRAVAYGMLRGWEEGFSVPSLGIAVATAYRGVGMSRILMEYLHCLAALKGATSVRLRTYVANRDAVRLFESMGYVWQAGECEDRLVGVLNLTSAKHNPCISRL